MNRLHRWLDRLFTKPPGPPEEGSGSDLLRRAQARLQEGKPGEAVECLGGAVRAFKIVGDVRNESHTLSLLATLHNDLGNFAAAAQYYTTGLEAARRLPDGDHLVVECLDGLGVAHGNRGRWQEALDRFDQALAAAGRIPNVAMRRLRAHVLLHRANVHLRYPRDYESALAGYDEALRISRELQDRMNVAFCLTFKGLCREAQGDVEGGIHFHEEARQLAEATGDPSILAMIHAHLGGAYSRLGQRSLAFRYGRSALELDEREGKQQGVVRDRMLLGGLLCQEGEDEKALGEYKQAFLLARAIQDLQNTLLIAKQIGGIYRRRRQPGARPYYEQALELCHELQGEKHIEIELRAHLATWLESMPARETLAELLAEAHQAGLPDLEQEIAAGLGDLARQDGDLEEAKSFYRTAVARLEEMRGSFRAEEFLRAFSAAHADVYQRLIQLCAKTGDDAGAFEYAERSRARVLSALLHGRSRHRQQPFSPAEERRHRALCQRVLDFDLALEEARIRKNPDVEEILSGLHEALLDESEMVLAALRAVPPGDRLDPAPVVTLQHLQTRLRGLPRNLLVLVYVTTEESAWLFAVDRIACELLPIPAPRRELRARVLAFRRSLKVPELDARHALPHEPSPTLPRDAAAGTQLFVDLIGPVLDRLARADHLCIVPHGSLHYLPFHALPDGDGFLIERLPISYAPSATLLHRSLEQPLGRVERVLALGNPASHLPPLPGAAAEVQSIAESLGARCRSEIGAAAQRQVLLGPDAAEFDTWHLATHAVFVRSAPHLSYFQLAPTAGDDGRVFAFELAGLQHAPRLVVASACQTALTEETPGDEVNGLLYSLLAAGCPTVVGSLWRVSDQTSTERLMTHLHRQMQRESSGFDLAQALRQAQIQLFRGPRKASPYFWAPFVVQGTWSTVLSASATAETVTEASVVVGPDRQVAILLARGESHLQQAARARTGGVRRTSFTDEREALEAAVESFSAALEIDATRPAAWRGRGLACLALGRLDRAAADLSRAVQIAPDDPLAQAGLALAWGDDPEHWEEALTLLERAFQIAPRLQMPCPPRNTERLRSILRTLRAQKAVAETSRALDLTPDDPALWVARGDAWFHLSWSHDAEKHQNLARSDYRTALRLEPGHALGRLRLAWLEYFNHRPGAVAAYARLAREHPDCAEAHLHLAKAQLHAGEAEAALAGYRTALRLDESLCDGWSGLGEALLETGDLEGATAAFEKAASCDPDDVDAHLYLKAIYAALGRYEDATGEERECLRTTGHPLYEGRLGVDLRDEIVEWIRSLAVRRRPMVQPVNRRQLETLFEQARALAQKGETRGALPIYTRILALDPDNALALAYRGGVHGELGEHIQARADLERAVELDPALAVAWFNLYSLHQDRWRLDEAKAALDRALLLDPQLRERLGSTPRQPGRFRSTPLEELLDEAYQTSGMQCIFCSRPLRKPTGHLLSISGDQVDEILAGVPYHCPACGADSCFQCGAVRELAKVLCKRCGHEMVVWGH